MIKSKSNIIFKISVVLIFIAGIFNMLSGNSVEGLLYMVLATVIIVLDFVLDILKILIYVFTDTEDFEK